MSSPAARRLVEPADARPRARARNPRLQLCANSNTPKNCPGPDGDRAAAGVEHPVRVERRDVERSGHEARASRRPSPIARTQPGWTTSSASHIAIASGAGRGDADVAAVPDARPVGRVDEPHPIVACGVLARRRPGSRPCEPLSATTTSNGRSHSWASSASSWSSDRRRRVPDRDHDAEVGGHRLAAGAGRVDRAAGSRKLATRSASARSKRATITLGVDLVAVGVRPRGVTRCPVLLRVVDQRPRARRPRR